MYGRDAARYEKAIKGHLPTPPDFSAETHKAWRKKHAEIGELIAIKDVPGLKTYKIEPISGSRKALYYWRNLAVIALEAA